MVNSGMVEEAKMIEDFLHESRSIATTEIWVAFARVI